MTTHTTVSDRWPILAQLALRTLAESGDRRCFFIIYYLLLILLLFFNLM